jgi:hypothetical protein
MSFSIKKRTKKDKDKVELEECDLIDKKYSKKCGINKKMLEIENDNRKELEDTAKNTIKMKELEDKINEQSKIIKEMMTKFNEVTTVKNIIV